jgi:hypothetical protein
MLTFGEFLEGLLAADRPQRRWLSRINTTPFTNARRRRLGVKAVRVGQPFRPTVREVIPRRLLANLI